MHSNFISTNLYDDHQARLQHIHELYPDKPVLITEHGYHTDRVKNEDERVNLFKAVLNIVRSGNYIIGASIGTFNDYKEPVYWQDPNSYRPRGNVDPLRNPRPLYNTLQREYSPVTIIQQGAVKNTTAREIVLYIERGHRLPGIYHRALPNKLWTNYYKSGKESAFKTVIHFMHFASALFTGNMKLRR